MARWIDAMKAELASNEGLPPRVNPSALVTNEECERHEWDYAGGIEWNYARSSYEVYNAGTQECRRGLAETEVEGALSALGVANSDWH